MGFNPRQLSVIGYANGFTLWHYTSDDPLVAMSPPDRPADASPGILDAGYFSSARDLLRRGDFVMVNGGTGHAMVVIGAASENALLLTIPPACLAGAPAPT